MRNGTKSDTGKASAVEWLCIWKKTLGSCAANSEWMKGPCGPWLLWVCLNTYRLILECKNYILYQPQTQLAYEKGGKLKKYNCPLYILVSSHCSLTIFYYNLRTILVFEAWKMSLLMCLSLWPMGCSSSNSKPEV